MLSYTTSLNSTMINGAINTMDAGFKKDLNKKETQADYAMKSQILDTILYDILKYYPKYKNLAVEMTQINKGVVTAER